ncbi:unnamed protein product [Scytosiphon promiscuus]
MSETTVGAGAPSARQLSVLWFTVLSAPLLIGVALALMVSMTHFEAVSPLFSKEILWGAALAAMAVMLLAGRFIRNFVMAPERLARRPLQGSKAKLSESGALAAAKVHVGMFVTLGMLDAVSVAIIAACFMHADADLALLNGVYTLVLAVVTKPDLGVALRETATALGRQG